MRALLVPAAGQLEVADIALPDVGPYDALVRMEACGICNSTDAKLIDGTMYWAPPFPFVLGHESVGTVVAVGPKSRKFHVGDQVTRPLAFWPGTPRADGLNVAMGGFSEMGIVRDGAAMAENGDGSLAGDYTALRQNVVPAGLSPEQAALAISLSECASVLRYLPPLNGRRIVVAGTGVAGLAFTLWARRAGAFVLALGRRDERLSEATHVGAHTVVNTARPGWQNAVREAANGALFDGAFEATGDAHLAADLLPLLAPDAFACAYGVPPTGTSYNARWKKATVAEHESYDEVAGLLARGDVKADWFTTHVWPFDDVVAAFGEVRRGSVVKGFVQLT